MSLKSASWKDAHAEALKKLILESGVKVTSTIAKELDPLMFKDFQSNVINTKAQAIRKALIKSGFSFLLFGIMKNFLGELKEDEENSGELQFGAPKTPISESASKKQCLGRSTTRTPPSAQVDFDGSSSQDMPLTWLIEYQENGVAYYQVNVRIISNTQITMRSVTVDGSSVSFEILFKKPSIAVTKQFVRPATLLSKHYDAWSDPQSAAVMGYFRNQKEHTLVKK